MTKTKCYEATIFHDGTSENLCVDLLALPYEKFDAVHPLLIQSDVVMEKGKGKPLPDFSNVIIKGSFNCSSYAITLDTVLPNGITELICLHSINNLDVLNNILPPSVEKIVIRTALFNNIKKDIDGALEIAQNFAKKHPYVIVTDGKNNLSDVLQQIEAEKNIIQTEKLQEITEEIKVEKKTKDWLSTDELMSAYKQNQDAIHDISDEDLERSFRIVRKKFNKRELMREDGAVISCVHRNDIQDIVTAINQQNKRDILQSSNSQQKTTAKNQTKSDEQKSEKGIKQNTTPQICVGTKEVQETVIKKYIKNNVWKEIQKHCKNDLDRQLSFLEAIEIINIKPIDTAGKKVCYIQDGTLKTSPTVTFKNIQWLTQGFGTQDDRSRIIWCMNEHGFIATEYFEEHEKKQSVDYKKAIRQKDVSCFTTKDTVSVSDLIKELSAKRDTKQINITETAQPEAETISKPATEDTVVSADKKTEKTPTEPTSAGAASASHTEQPVQKRVRKRIACQQVTHVQTTDNKDHNVLNNIKWIDYDSLHASFVVKIQDLNTTQSKLLQKLIHETQTDSALEYTHQLQIVLYKKQQCEKALNKLKNLNQKLQKLKQDYSKLM